MSDHTIMNRLPCPQLSVLVLALGLVPWLVHAQVSLAEESKLVGRASPLPGAILHRQGPEKIWRMIKPTDPIQSDDILVGVPGGAIDSRNGAVRLTLLSDLARLSPNPILESAVVLHENPDVDLDFTLDRGRIDLTNLKKDGAVHVRVHFRNKTWDLTLEGPKAKVGLELYGRWPKGIPFSKDAAKAKEEPTGDLVLIVLNGEANLKADGDRFALRAPPGPAYFHWDSVAGNDQGPQRLEELPAWARPALSMLPRAKDLGAVLKLIQQRVAENSSIQDVLIENISSDNPNVRRIAVYGLGALDDVSHLIDSLGHARHDDVRDIAVVALRAWIGRGPGQDAKLYHVLIEDKKYSPNQAEIVMQLLHSFGDNDLARPATYETLIDYLTHDKPAIRKLASWHLYRNVPAGKSIEYNPAGSEEDRQRAYDKWKKLVPSGKMPPAATDKKSK